MASLALLSPICKTTTAEQDGKILMSTQSNGVT